MTPPEPFDAPQTFPTVRWKRERATFLSGPPPPDDGLPEPAALIFPFYGDRVVLADIPTRGWCIPSGHLEPGETPEEAVRREAWEEAGAEMGEVAYLGWFRLTDAATGAVRRAPTFIGAVRGLAPLPPGTESRGMQMVNYEDVATMYFAWDDLLAAVFTFAYEEKQRRFRPGVSVSSLTG